MKKLLVISNTSFSIEKFRSHYLNKLSRDFKILVITPNNRPKNLLKPKFKSFKSKNFFLETIKIINIINKFRPDKFIVFSVKYQFIVSCLAIFKKLNLIFIIAGQGTIFLIKNPILIFIRKIIFNFIFRMGQIIIFINPSDKKFFEENFKVSLKTHLINTEGLEVFKFKKKKNKKINFIFFARIIFSKGISDYIQSAKYIKKLYPHVKFFIAGPLDKEKIGQTFSLQKNIYKLIKSNEHITKYIGYKNNYKKIFNKMDCLISPSYTEGAGTSVMEAMISGLYVVAYKNNGHNFILKNTKNYLCKSNNISCLLDGIEHFLKMKNEDLDKNALNSYNKVNKNFSSKNVYRKIKKIISI